MIKSKLEVIYGLVGDLTDMANRAYDLPPQQFDLNGSRSAFEAIHKTACDLLPEYRARIGTLNRWPTFEANSHGHTFSVTTVSTAEMASAPDRKHQLAEWCTALLKKLLAIAEEMELPARSEASEGEADVYLTGAPGRPSSMQLVLAELNRLIEAGQLDRRGVAAQSKALAEWLRKSHPKAPQPTPQTIANSIRDKYRPHKNKI